jgi:hypothetical protein
MHPTLSNMKLTDSKFYPFIQLARKFRFPIEVHTENDGKSYPGLLIGTRKINNVKSN